MNVNLVNPGFHIIYHKGAVIPGVCCVLVMIQGDSSSEIERRHVWESQDALKVRHRNIGTADCVISIAKQG